MSEHAERFRAWLEFVERGSRTRRELDRLQQETERLRAKADYFRNGEVDIDTQERELDRLRHIEEAARRWADTEGGGIDKMEAEVALRTALTEGER